MSKIDEIEQAIGNFPLDEQLRLAQRVAQRVRETQSKKINLEKQLREMASDPQIQNELKRIDDEFANAENDGLGE